jgi:hypothetical protein
VDAAGLEPAANAGEATASAESAAVRIKLVARLGTTKDDIAV